MTNYNINSSFIQLLRLVLTAGLLICFVPLPAQKNGKFHLATAGVSINNIDDASVQPSSFSGQTIDFQYALLKQDRKRKTELSVDLNTGNLSIEDGQTCLTDLSITLADGFRISGKGNRQFSFYIGYVVNYNPAFIKVKGKDDNYTTWNSSSSICFYQSYNYSWRKQSFSIDISIPLLGFSSRPQSNDDYAGNMNGALYNSLSNVFVTSVHNNAAAALIGRFQRTLTPAWQFVASATYKVNDMQSAIPVKRESLGIRAGVAVKIR